MVVTVNTDASYCPIQKVGGYAFWIKCDLGTIAKSGAIKTPENAQDCEIKAVANAVYVLENSTFNNGNIALVVINSDCKKMFPLIGKKSQHAAGRSIANAISRIRKKNKNITSAKKIYSLRHVKAHNGTADKRSWVNDWCDRQAKIAMQSQRKPFQPQNREYLPAPVPGLEPYSKVLRDFETKMKNRFEQQSNV